MDVCDEFGVLILSTNMYGYIMVRHHDHSISGNITEKLRVSKFDCSKEVVVDLYAGLYEDTIS
jgi:hypothetical protein